MTTFEQEVVDAMPEFLLMLGEPRARVRYLGFHGGIQVGIGLRFWTFSKNTPISEVWATIVEDQIRDWAGE